MAAQETNSVRVKRGPALPFGDTAATLEALQSSANSTAYNSSDDVKHGKMPIEQQTAHS